MRAQLTWNLWATVPVGSPTAKQRATFRWRSESRLSQAAKSTRIAASSAGVACRDSPKSSDDRSWPSQQPGSADITRNPNRRCVTADMTSRLLRRDPIGLPERTRCAA